MRHGFGPAEVEAAICRLSLERHALARDDLLELGLSPQAIARRVRCGRLVLLHRGVYAIGGTPATQERRWAAAVLACGEAVLSYRSAVALWRLSEVDPVVIDVSLAGRSGRARQGIRVHRPRHLYSRDITSHRGIPATTVARTLIDCAEVIGSRSLERILDEAQYLKLLDASQLAGALERHRSRAGAARLQKLLARHQPGATRTRSRLEEAFLLLVRRAELPQPKVNVRLGPYTIDFLWPGHRVAVETDGRAAHEREGARERDYQRDSWLNANGYRPLRFTWAQVHDHVDEVLAALHAVLGAADELRPPRPNPR